MIPILYAANAIAFDTMGIGALADAISCNVVEERNGEFELEMEYPITGIHYSEIRHSSIICAVPHQGANKQPFRIYKITRPINGVVTVYAQHISYQLSYIPVAPFTATSAAMCLQGFSLNAMEPCPFTFWTDKTTVASYKQTQPESIRARLGGVSGSVLDVYGGEWEFDGYEVKLHNARGADRGVVLRYGKNITDLQQEETIAETYTGVLPVWVDSEGGCVVYGDIAYSSNAGNYPYHRTKVVDFSTSFETKPTAAQLTARAQQYVVSNRIGVPKVGIDVKFVPLWETEEYAQIAPLERVYLCDTVTVYYEKLGVSASAKVTKTDYNVLLDRYNEIMIGEHTSTLAETISGMEQDTAEIRKEAVSRSALQIAIDTATAQITGESGGYIVINRDANGNPYELLIMDTNDINTATQVWRWNQSGLGYSSHGYNGPYGTAITQDGKIVADYITSGVLQANLIKILGTSVFYWDASNIYIIDPSDANNQIRIGQYDGSHYGIGFTHDGGVTWNTAMNFNGLNVQATGFAKVFVQIEDPNDGSVQINTGDLWIQSSSDTVWATLANITWGDVDDKTWGDYISNADPVTYVWDGQEWQTAMDTALLHNMQTELAQTETEIALKANQSALDLLAQTVATNSANITLNANAITAEVTRATAAEGTLSSTISQDKSSWQATFRSMGADGYTKSGITTIGASGITVTHSSVSNCKTEMSASGFRILNSSNSVMGGLISLNGSAVMASQALYNPLVSNLNINIGSGLYSSEDGLLFKLGGTNCFYLNAITDGFRIKSFSTTTGIYASGNSLQFSSSGTIRSYSGQFVSESSDSFNVFRRVNNVVTTQVYSDGSDLVMSAASAIITIDNSDGNIVFRFKDSYGVTQNFDMRTIWDRIGGFG